MSELKNHSSDEVRGKGIVLLREADVRERLGIGHSSLWARVRDGRLSPPLKIAGAGNRWPSNLVDLAVGRMIREASSAAESGS
jgi:hypothetical protein